MATPARAVAARVAADARTRTLSFCVLFFAVVAANAIGYRDSYPNVADRMRLVTAFADNKAARIFYGAGHDLVTVGGYTAWRAGGLLAIFAGLFGIFAAARAMRADEDAGRTELVLAGALTRSGQIRAVLVGIALTLAALWTATTVGALVGGLALGGSCYLGLVLLTVAMVYVGVGAVANQVLPTRRGALGASAAVLGVDFLLRVVADTTDAFSLHWVSPLGWAEEMRAFSGSHALVVLLPLVTTVLLLSLAVVLYARRDLGHAYVAPHDTARPRLGLLSSPFRLALRLDRTAIATWALSIAVFAFVVGTVAKSVEDLDLHRELREQIEKIGGIDITRASGYVGLTFLIFVFAIGLFVCGQMSAVRDEESSHRLETLLSLPYGRTQWLGGRIALIVGAGVVTGVGAGLGAGLGVLVTGGDMTFAQGLEAGVNLLPAMVLFVGVGVAALAFAPRVGVGLLYAFVVVTFVWDLFGALLSFPDWLLDVSPFHHIAPAPAKSIAVVSAIAMLVVGIGAALVGTARFGRRDLTGD